MSKLGSRINNLRRECVNSYCIDEDLQREFIEIRKEVEEIYKLKVHLPDVIGVSLAKDIVNILEVKCLAGCSEKHKTWQGFQNGNGTDVGKDIERLIRKAKRIIKQDK